MDLRAATEAIDNFLHSGLAHTGPAGFEGLIAVLFQQATGQEFRLSSSGRQYGRDAASESGYANNIKIEAKHYAREAELHAREVIAEIEEASVSDPNLDIWVLVSSCCVKEQLACQLNEHADHFGVDLVLLDLGVNGLPRIAVLMAAFPQVVIEWATLNQIMFNCNEVGSALGTVAEQAGFEASKKALFAKLNGTVGYDGARLRIHRRLLHTLSDPGNAQSAFRQSLGIRSPETQIIRRTELNKRLDEWWDGSRFPRPAVALGEEGTGKTWAVFDWAMGRIDRDDMPIVLPFAAVAQELNNSDPVESLLSRLLAKWTGVQDDNRWKRRLVRWLDSDPVGGPLMLLIVDGLNERASVDWRPFFSTLLSAPWRERVAVLATDRPHHWRENCSKAGLGGIYEFMVEGYSDAELDLALSSKRISHNDIPLELLPLISRPRYCRLVADHYQEMIAEADFTRERLIYLEIKDRQRSKLQYPISDEWFAGIIRDLAQRARVNPELRPQELRALISIPGGDEATIYEEIIGGGLLIPGAGQSTVPTFKVEPLRLVYGFGMLLADELASKASANSTELEEFLTGWFEPQRDMDRKVDICGSAMFHALFESGYPETPLRELIRYWLGLRNWGDMAQSAAAMYVLRRPKIFVEVAEHFWSSTDDSGAAQEFLGRAFATHRNDPRLQPVLKDAIERWMGFVHPSGHRWWRYETARAGAAEHEEEDRVRKGIEVRAGCPISPGVIEVAGTKLTVIADKSLLRLARLGLMIMSAGDRAPFVRSLVPWAVASAVMDDPEFSELVSWVIRLGDQAAEDVLTDAARRLLSMNEATASTAARTLLFAIGSQESKRLIDEYNLTPEWYKEHRREHASDPCKSIYDWTESECVGCLGREDVPLRKILGRAGLPVLDPAIDLSASLVERAKAALMNIDPRMIRAALSHTAEGTYLETLSPILWARAPSTIADFMRTVVSMMPDRDVTGQYSLAVYLDKISLLLRSREVRAVSRAILELSEGASQWIKDAKGEPYMRKVAETNAFRGIAPHLTPSDLFRTLLARPANAWDLTNLGLWLAPIPPDEGGEVRRLLHSASDHTTLRRILWTLPHLGFALSESDRDRLVCLAESEDEVIRISVLRAAVLIKDELLARRIIDLGESPRTERDPMEEHWGTLLLAQFAGHLQFEDLAKRMRPSAIGWAIRSRGDRSNEIQMYAECLDRVWHRIISAVDPEIGGLPTISAASASEDTGVQLPKLYEPAATWRIRLDRSRSWTSGPPIDAASLHKLLNPDTEEQIREMNEARRRKVDLILDAWRTDAFQWYGRGFSVQTIEQIYDRFPELVERWAEPALADSLTGISVRQRLGTFLEPICSVLLNRHPQLGFKLWESLHRGENDGIVFDVCHLAFAADDNAESIHAREILLDEAWNDESLARITFACEAFNRRAWLHERIEALIAAGRFWKRIKGLTMASFSEVTPERFDELVSGAMVVNSWADDSLQLLRQRVRKNWLARHWYSVFLAAEDNDAAWGALEIALSLADERLLNWQTEVENACHDRELAARRIRFLRLRWSGQRDVPAEISRERDRKEQLFGRKIQKGEIAPFM